MSRLACACLLLLSASGAFGQSGAQGGATTWAAKVDASVLAEAASKGETDFFVVLDEQADLRSAALWSTRVAKATYVMETLQAVAKRTQPAVAANLDALGVRHKAFWIANMILARGTSSTVAAIAARIDVKRIEGNPRVTSVIPTPGAAPGGAASTSTSTSSVEWNLTKVGAPTVWSQGYTGQGIVVGGQDTGYQWDHPAIKAQYRGWDGSVADHNHNWHDATIDASTVPVDDNGHGTHTMGTMVGNDMATSDPSWPAGATNAIGMAPGARWIGCRNMKNGVGTAATYVECYQWFIAPTDLSNANPDPALGPDVINNSWGCPPSESGCSDPGNVPTLLAAVRSVVAAGILTVHSAGNSGSSCSTVRDPAAIYGETFAVGATDSTDNIAGFSSRGPVTVDGSGRMKPDISAPGVSVRSAYTTSTYRSLQGTSMAAPHVAGAAALLLSARPGLRGNVAALEHALTATAVALTTSQGCGGDSATAVPNNVYGAGRLDVVGAITRVLSFPTFTEDPIVIRGTTVKAVHITELRQRIDELRTRFSLGAFVYTEAALNVGVTTVKAAHIVELRTALGEAYVAAGKTAPTFSAAPAAGGTVSALHIAELRAAVIGLW